MSKPAKPLSDDQRNELKTALATLVLELQKGIEVGAEATKPVDLDQPIGRLSRIDAIQQQKMALAGRTKLETRLRLVSAALARLAQKDYGICEDCEEPISFRRLRAKPESRLCLDCQSAQEL